MEVKTVLLPKVAEVTIDINNSGVMDIQFKTFSHAVQMLVTLNWRLTPRDRFACYIKLTDEADKLH